MAGLSVLMVLVQRQLIYAPPRGYSATPKDAGLAYEDVVLTASDGIRVRAWWIPVEGEGAPAVICFHGNATNISGMIENAVGWRMRGFSCLLADYRGYGLSEGSPTEAGLARDAIAAYKWLIERGSSPARVVLYGHSLGAGVAAGLAAEKAVGGIVLEGAFSSVYAMARHHYWWVPVPEFAIRDRFPVVENVARVTCPILMIHGEEDTIVPIEQARKVFEAAPAPKFFVSVPGADHNSLNLFSREGMAALEVFLGGFIR